MLSGWSLRSGRPEAFIHPTVTETVSFVQPILSAGGIYRHPTPVNKYVAVLLIVCINLMNLMMVRSIAQRRDWAIRLAMGAKVRDLLRGAFIESLLLSLAGGTAGSLLAWVLLRLVRLKAPIDLPRIDELSVDSAALLFALSASVATAILFGIWPAWRASRINPQEPLQSSVRTASESRQGHHSGNILVAAEVTLSTVLLLSAGLL